MNFFDFFNIAERYLEIINPISAEKVLRVGEILKLHEGSRLIDYGCGYAEPLVLWAERYGISATGIDVRKHACERAHTKIMQRGLGSRLEIVCGRGAEYPMTEGSFDAATCLGASFIWNGFEPAVAALRRAVRTGGRAAIGEPYWLTDDVPAEYREAVQPVHNETKLLEIIRAAGFELEYVIRSSTDDWDAYEAGNWRGLVAWIEENPDHPELNEVVDYLHRTQDEYARCGRQYLGWAVYMLVARA